MNISKEISKNKDQTIINIISFIEKEINKSLIDIVDYWDGDLHAIGFRNKLYEEKIIYISSYKQPEGFYYCDFEIWNMERNELEYDIHIGAVNADELIYYIKLLLEIE